MDIDIKKELKPSNYKIFLKYKGEEEVIDFEQFKSLTKLLVVGNSPLAFINGSYLKVSDIRRVSPTTDLTPSQIEAKELREASKSAESTLEGSEQDRYFRARNKFFDKKYGEDQWGFYPLAEKQGKHFVNENDLEEFKKYYNSIKKR